MKTYYRLIFSLFFAIIACSFDMQAMHIPAVSKKQKNKTTCDSKAATIIFNNWFSLINSLNKWSYDKEPSKSIKDFQALNLCAVLTRVILICHAHSVSIDSVIEEFKITPLEDNESLYSLLLKFAQIHHKDSTSKNPDQITREYIEDIYNLPIKLTPKFEKTSANNIKYLADIGDTHEDILIDLFTHCIRANNNDIIPALHSFLQFSGFVNKLDPHGFNLIHYAVFFDNIPVVTTLLEMKADLNINQEMPVLNLIRSKQMHTLLNKHLSKINASKATLNEAQQLAQIIAALKHPKQHKDKKQKKQTTSPTTHSTTAQSRSEQISTVPAKKKDHLATVSAACPQTAKDDTQEKKDCSTCTYDVDPAFGFFVISSALHSAIELQQATKANFLKGEIVNTLMNLAYWYQKNRIGLNLMFKDFDKKKVGDKTISQLLDNITIENFFPKKELIHYFNGFEDVAKIPKSPELVKTWYEFFLLNLIRAGFEDQFKKWLPNAVKNGLDISQDEKPSLLLTAVAYNQLSIAELLVKQNANVNVCFDGICPLLLARFHEMRSLLLHARADINHMNKDGETPLILAAKSMQKATIKALLQYEPIPNLQKNEALLSKAVHCDAIDNRGKTALHWFLERKFVVDRTLQAPFTQIIQLLDHEKQILETLKDFMVHHANLHIADKNGTTPMMICAERQDWNTLKLLVESPTTTSAHLSMHDNLGRTVLTITRDHKKNCPTINRQAQKLYYEKLIQLLTSRGASVNTPDNNGFTPLMTAAKEGNLKQVCLLLECKADPKIKHKDSYKTAQDFAKDSFAETKNSTFMSIIGALNGVTIYDITGLGAAEVADFGRALKKASDALTQLFTPKKSDPLAPNPQQSAAEIAAKREKIIERLNKSKAEKEKAKLELAQKKLEEEKKKQEEAHKAAQAEIQARKGQEQEKKKQAEQQEAATAQTTQPIDTPPSPTQKKQAKNRGKKKGKRSKYAYTKDITDQPPAISPAVKEEPAKKEILRVDSLCPNPKKCTAHFETRFNAGQDAVKLASEAFQKHKDSKYSFTTRVRSRFNTFLLPEHRSSPELNGYLEHLEDKTACKSCKLDKQKIKDQIAELARIQNVDEHTLAQCKQKKMVNYA